MGPTISEAASSVAVLSRPVPHTLSLSRDSRGWPTLPLEKAARVEVAAEILCEQEGERGLNPKICLLEPLQCLAGCRA